MPTENVCAPPVVRIVAGPVPSTLISAFAASTAVSITNVAGTPARVQICRPKFDAPAISSVPASSTGARVWRPPVNATTPGPRAIRFGMVAPVTLPVKARRPFAEMTQLLPGIVTGSATVQTPSPVFVR